MNKFQLQQPELSENGFSILNNIFSPHQIAEIISVIENNKQISNNYRKSSSLFAIRCLIKEIPQLKELIFQDPVKDLIKENFGTDYFLVKSIYFDKPGDSNWSVAWHQDLSIATENKIESENFTTWISKDGQYSVQAPQQLLEKNFTIRIHLDDTNENNGALKILSGSHKKGKLRTEQINWLLEKEILCNVDAGGVMIMRPLLIHSSSKSKNSGNRRRVIHLEFSNQQLPDGLKWGEYEKIPSFP